MLLYRERLINQSLDFYSFFQKKIVSDNAIQAADY